MASIPQIVVDAAQAYGIDPRIFFAQMGKESSFNPNLVGGDGEIGVAQFMAGTWPLVILAHPELQEPPFNAVSTPNGRSNVLANIYAAAAHMSDLLAQFGNYQTALAGYNGGAGGTQLPAAQNYATGVLGRAQAMTQQEDSEFAAALGGDGGGEAPILQTNMQLWNVETGEVITIDRSTPADGSRWRQLGTTTPLTGFWSTASGWAFSFAAGVPAGVPRSLDNATALRIGLPGVTAAAGPGGRTIEEDIQLLQTQHDLAIQRGDHERAADFKNQIDILKKQQDFTFKMDRLNALDNLTTTILGLQQQARTSGIEAIGRDPFRGAIQAQGGTPIGRSPFERLRREQLDFAEAQIPTVGSDASTGDVQAAIDEAQGLVTQVPKRPIGLKHGGTVRIGRGGFTNIDTGEVGDHLIVGEAGVERIDMSNGMITVTPQGKRSKSGLRAEHGGTFQLDNPINAPTQPHGGFETRTEQFGQEALSRAQTLFPLFEALGFSEVPLIRRGATGGIGDVLGGPTLGSMSGEFGATFGSQPLAADPVDVFGRLGTRPRLIFDPDLGLFIHVNEDTGEIQILGDITTAVRDFSINPADAVTMSVNQLRESGFGGGVNASRRQESLIGSARGQFSERTPLISPLDIGQTVGILLPDPRMIAAVWGDLDLGTQSAVLSAYGLAGVSEGQFQSRIRFFTPQGGQTAAGGGFAFNQRAGRVASAAGLPSAA